MDAPQRVLTDVELDEFNERGVLVIKNVLTQEEVDDIRKSFHSHLMNTVQCDVDNLEETAANLSRLSSTGGAGGILDVFYAEWKLKINEHPIIYSLVCDLWKNTYCKNSGAYTHPYTASTDSCSGMSFNPNHGYMYIDRIGYRVSDNISKLHSGVTKKKKPLQRSLTPHLDCCPHRLYDSEKEFPKWRPIQMLLPLTDTLNKDEGGFEVCPGIHNEFEKWVANRKPSATSDLQSDSISSPHPPCVGEFTPIRPVEDADILKRMQHVPCGAGDLVVWDYRLPHANSRFNTLDTSREVIYLGRGCDPSTFDRYNISELILHFAFYRIFTSCINKQEICTRTM